MSSLPEFEATQSPQNPQNPGYVDNNVFRWVDDMPAPSNNTRSIRKEQIQELHNAALAMPYTGVWDSTSQQWVMDDPLYEGMTNAEVMIYKRVRKAAAEGDDKATSDILDRTLGKPKQAVEVASMHMSYSEFLEQSAAEERAKREQSPSHTPHVLNIASDMYLEDLIRGI
jgi:hypothetical protein